MSSFTRKTLISLSVLAIAGSALLAAPAANAVAPSKYYAACSDGYKEDIRTAEMLLASEIMVRESYVVEAKAAWYADKQNQALKSAYYAAKSDLASVKAQSRAFVKQTRIEAKAEKKWCQDNGGTYRPGHLRY